MTNNDDMSNQNEERTDTPLRYVERHVAYAVPSGPEYRPYSTSDIVVVPLSVRIDYAGGSSEELTVEQDNSVYVIHPDHPSHSDPDWEVPGLPVGAMSIVHEDAIPTPQYTYSAPETGVIAGRKASDWDYAVRNRFTEQMTGFADDPTQPEDRRLYRDGGMGLPTSHVPQRQISDYWAGAPQKPEDSISTE